MEKSDFDKLTKQEKLKVPVKDLPKQQKMSKGCLGLLIIVAIIIAIVGVFQNSNNDKVAENLKKGIDSTSLYYYSKVMAQQYVKQVLKAPSTAKFPDEELHIGYNPDSTVIVKIGVDAQNSYGAMIRSNYILKMKWYKDFTDTENWRNLAIADENN